MQRPGTKMTRHLSTNKNSFFSFLYPNLSVISLAHLLPVLGQVLDPDKGLPTQMTLDLERGGRLGAALGLGGAPAFARRPQP